MYYYCYCITSLTNKPNKRRLRAISLWIDFSSLSGIRTVVVRLSVHLWKVRSGQVRSDQSPERLGHQGYRRTWETIHLPRSSTDLSAGGHREHFQHWQERPVFEVVRPAFLEDIVQLLAYSVACIDTKADRQTDRQTRQTDWMTDKCTDTDRQTERHTLIDRRTGGRINGCIASLLSYIRSSVRPRQHTYMYINAHGKVFDFSPFIPTFIRSLTLHYAVQAAWPQNVYKLALLAD